MPDYPYLGRCEYYSKECDILVVGPASALVLDPDDGWMLEGTDYEEEFKDAGVDSMNYERAWSVDPKLHNIWLIDEVLLGGE